MTDGPITKFPEVEDSCQAEIEKLIMTCKKNKEREYLFLKERRACPLKLRSSGFLLVLLFQQKL